VRVGIAAMLVVWAAAFAAVVTEARSPDSASGSGTGGYATSQARAWMTFERVSGGWRHVRGPFAGAEACLRISDALNNENAGHVFDCDEAPKHGVPRANTHVPRSRTVS
jgi:hypothetical protein